MRENEKILFLMGLKPANIQEMLKKEQFPHPYSTVTNCSIYSFLDAKIPECSFTYGSAFLLHHLPIRLQCLGLLAVLQHVLVAERSCHDAAEQQTLRELKVCVDTPRCKQLHICPSYTRSSLSNVFCHLTKVL